MNPLLRDDARTIWHAAVAAVRPETLLPPALKGLGFSELLKGARRVLVVGGGKAGASMAAATEQALAEFSVPVEGLVNVPADQTHLLQSIYLHVARPAGTNQPTAAGVEGSRRILELVRSAGPNDVVLCLLSGGGSALLPAPAEGVTLSDKQHVTLLLHACGATINEMNAVRKHLSAIKGGRLAQAFHGKALHSLIISDVIGDPLDVIASGPTAADPTTFADALAVLDKYHLRDRVLGTVLRHLEEGAAGQITETLKALPANVHNHLIGNNVLALTAAQRKAEELGYRVVNLGSFIEGETGPVATALAGILRSIKADGRPVAPPACILSGGETTVALSDPHGLGGRNQEFVLATVVHLGPGGLGDVAILSGGTDGEDGPTDAAGAVADETTWPRAEQLGLSPAAYLKRHDAYHFFSSLGDLLQTGLTQTNVMDVRVTLVR